MLQLLTTDEFARWFSALDDGAAEDVAATLDVIAQLGVGTEAPNSSEWLLWYEHPAMAERMRLAFAEQHESLQKSLRHAQQWGAFRGYVGRVLKHLESPQFAARLGGLSPRQADKVYAAVEHIRAASKARSLGLSEVMRRLSHVNREAWAGELARFFDISDVRQSYFAALAAAGFAVTDVPAHSRALREIELRSRALRLRLLYGVDPPRNRALVVLGEWLERTFYGDSVRRAEQLWQQFLAGDLSSTQPASGR